MSQKIAIIIGAGPAGLTAAYELAYKTNIKPIIFEQTSDIGGISKTVIYKGNRIDLGGHRFFSKSDIVMDWWQNILPVQGSPSKDDIKLNRVLPLSKNEDAPDPEKTDKVMLIRQRLSRIFFLGKFFDYPVTLNSTTFFNLGITRVVKIVFSYLKICLFPIKNEKSLEDFFINRFGNELYKTFFKDYTEKVWGIECNKISNEWGKQRIKGLSITKTIAHAIKTLFVKDESFGQKKVETTLIGQFFYPKLGPGMLWEEVANLIKEKGGELHFNHKVISLNKDTSNISNIQVKNTITKEIKNINGDFFLSTMPVSELIHGLGIGVPAEVIEVADGLIYRDFIAAGVLLKKLKIKNKTKINTINNIIPDNWIYIQEKNVKVGRLQIVNNWSPYMVKDENTVWICMEYFCNIGDNLWSKSDKEFSEFAIEELAKINFINFNDVIDSVVVRMPKTYPAYFGTFNRFDVIRNYTDKIENLFLIGRNGMHKYNSTDHPMLTAITAVENIINNVTTKDNIWDIDPEQEYYDKKTN